MGYENLDRELDLDDDVEFEELEEELDNELELLAERVRAARYAGA